MATQSLPSFAQAFSSPSLNNISTGSKLPPIQSQNVTGRSASTPPRKDSPKPPSSESPIGTVKSRKRPRASHLEGETREADGSGSDQDRVKEEQDQDMLADTPPPTKVARLTDTEEARSNVLPASAPVSHRRRRSTISGAPNVLISDMRQQPLSESANVSPVSPVVVGAAARDDPSLPDNPRSGVGPKQKQQHASNDQRRAGGLSSSTGAISIGSENETSSPSLSSAAVQEDRLASHKPPSTSSSSRHSRRSPNPLSSPAGTRRTLSNSSIMPHNARPPSPSPMIVPSQAPSSQSNATLNALAAPPISFGRRRAGQLGSGKKKPADILISPREAHTAEQLQPAIQSAPPVPQGNQGQFYSGRFSMTLPRLPSVMSNTENIRRVSRAQVPPTPTRFTMFRNSSATSAAPTTANANAANANTPTHLAPPPLGSTRPSPPVSVPISTTLVPPTPNSLHHPGYTGEKSAFLAQFETFYDALNDSKQLKTWLGEQLHRSNNLMQTLAQHQDRTLDMIETVVEKRVCGMRNEIQSLRRRVDELEGALRETRPESVGRRPSVASLGDVNKGKQPVRNGAAEPYTFPPVDSMRMRQPESVPRPPSPVWREQDSEGAHSPALYEAHRRLSVSATRLDPPPPLPQASVSVQESSPKSRPPFVVQSQSYVYRDGGGKPSRTTFERSQWQGGAHSRSHSKSHHPHASEGGGNSGEGKEDGRSPRVSHSRTSSSAAMPASLPVSAKDEH